MAIDIQARFRREVHTCLKTAEQIYSVDFGRVTVGFDIRSSDAGQAYCSPHPRLGRIYGLRFNKRALVCDWEDMVHSTIPHEVAHLVAFARPDLKIVGHDYKWRSIAINLGDTSRGARYHELDVSPVRYKTMHIDNP